MRTWVISSAVWSTLALHTVAIAQDAEAPAEEPSTATPAEEAPAPAEDTSASEDGEQSDAAGADDGAGEADSTEEPAETASEAVEEPAVEEAPAAEAPAVEMAEDGLPTWYPRFEEEKPPPTHRFWYRNALFGRVNPLGLQDQLHLGYRYQLVKKTGLLYGDSYLFVGAAVNASPSFARVGARVETMPIALVRLWAQYQFIQYLGTFDNLTSFSGPNEPYSDNTLDALGSSYLASGGVFETGIRVQAKVGPVAVRNTAAFSSYHLKLQNGDTYFYEQFWDRLVPNNGWIVQNDLDVLAVIGKTTVGLRYTYSDTIIGDGSLADEENHRLGPLFAFKFHERDAGARFNNPTLFFAAQWWLKHPYRSGQEQPVGLPLIALGLMFDGDLVGDRPGR